MTTPKTPLLQAARDGLAYLLSLPERTLRSLAALVGGTVTVLTETILPDAVRDSTIYRITLGLTLQFLVERVAQVEREGEVTLSVPSLQPRFAQRKLAGTVLETAGLVAIRFSPLWVFAIAADAAAGSKLFLERLAEHLRRNGVIAEGTRIEDLVDVLAAMQQATGKSATAIDTPPLSRAELAQLADDLRTSYGRAFLGTSNLVQSLEGMWGRMQAVAQQEHVPVERVGGIMTLDLAGWGKKGFGATKAFGRTGAELFGENILASYSRTLDGIVQEGADKYFGKRMRPFLQVAVGQFSRDKATWIESRLKERKRGEDDGQEC